MRPKSIILLVLALGCGLVASIGINQVLANRNQVVISAPGEMTPIYVALKDINQGESLTADKIKLQDWPKDQVPVGSLTKIEDVEGRVTRTRFVPNQPILEGNLYAKGDKGAGAGTLIPPGMRVVAVRVDAVNGAAGMILPGDRVDVVVYLQENAGRSIARTLTKTILQNVTVFAVDNIYDRGNNGETTVAAKTVSMLVTPEHAELVMLASEMGTIRLVMRGTDDNEIVDTTGKDPTHFTSHKSTPTLDPSPGPADGAGLLAVLEQQRQQLQEPARPANSGWKMVVFEGGEYREFEVQNENLGLGRMVPHLGEPSPATDFFGGDALRSLLGGDKTSQETDSTPDEPVLPMNN